MRGSVVASIVVSMACVACQRTLGERAQEREAQAELAENSGEKADLQRALGLRREAARLYHEAGDVAGEARATAAVGILLHILKDDDPRAVEALEQAVALYAKAGDAEGELKHRIYVVATRHPLPEQKVTAYDEIAQQLHLPLTTVKVRIHRARLWLSESLEIGEETRR